jgi:hypothetical protein
MSQLLIVQCPDILPLSLSTRTQRHTHTLLLPLQIDKLTLLTAPGSHDLSSTPRAKEPSLYLHDVDTKELGFVRWIGLRVKGEGEYSGLIVAAPGRRDAAVPFDIHF